MDWPTIINEILWMEEITEKKLCASLNTPITPSALNSLKLGHTLNPKYNLGSELIKRHKLLKRQQANQQVTAYENA